jgi:hypothetical protein
MKFHRERSISTDGADLAAELDAALAGARVAFDLWHAA